jgi:cation:H+ antiporter
MPLDPRQTEELFLTAAQSLLAMVVLANLRFGLWEATLLFGLFAVQFVVPSTAVRLWLSVGYLVTAAAYVAGGRTRRAVWELLRIGWRV